MAGEFRMRDDAADDRMAGTPSVLAYAPRLLVYPFTGFGWPVLLLGTPGVWMLAQAVQAFIDLDVLQMRRWVTGIVLLVMTVVILTYYILRIVEHTASGHATPPPMGGEVLTNIGRVFGQAMFYPSCVATLCYGLRDSAAAWWVAGFAVVLWPAHLLVMATERSVLEGFNPLRLLNAVAGTGPYYVLVCAATAGASWLMLRFASSSYALLSSAAGLYMIMVICHLLGFVAYHRHRELGLDVEVGDPEAKRRKQEQAQRLQDLYARIDAYMQGRNVEGAAREMFNEPGGPDNVLQFHEDLYSRLMTYKYGDLILLQGQRLVTLLLDGRRIARALEVYEACLGRNIHFEPESPRQLEVLAREALNSKYEDLFLKMLRNLETRYPDDPILVSTGLMQARFWSDLRRDDGRALEILLPLLKHEAHPQHGQVVSLVRVLRST
jgi:hypothetical protein